jgi:hypothetical protein
MEHRWRASGGGGGCDMMGCWWVEEVILCKVAGINFAARVSLLFSIFAPF